MLDRQQGRTVLAVKCLSQSSHNMTPSADSFLPNSDKWVKHCL